MKKLCPNMETNLKWDLKWTKLFKNTTWSGQKVRKIGRKSVVPPLPSLRFDPPNPPPPHRSFFITTHPIIKGKLELQNHEAQTTGILSLYVYHLSTVVDFSSEKYSGSTGHRSSWY